MIGIVLDAIAVRGFDCVAAERLFEPGLPKLARVSESLYQGADPLGIEGYHSLVRLGIKTVVSLRSEPDNEWLLGGIGLECVHIPVPAGSHPSFRARRRFLEVVSDRERLPVFVHCARGRHRTVAMVALYRTGIQGWSFLRARRESLELQSWRSQPPGYERRSSLRILAVNSTAENGFTM